MKILFLVPSGTQRSHARFRVLPLVEQGQRSGMDVSYKAVPRSLLKRYAFFSRLPHVDVLVVHRELFSAYELGTLRRLCKTLVYDCSDAVWTLPELELRRFDSGLVAAKLHRRFERVCREADLCIVDNRPIAQVVSQYQDQVRIMPTCVDTNWFIPGHGGKVGGSVLVGWMGTPGDEPSLQDAMGYLEPHAGSIQFSVVSREPYTGPGREYVFWNSWSESDEPLKLQAMDIGLTPRANEEFARSACGVDVLRYMASGLAVVASDIGGAADIIDHGIDGFLIRDAEDWPRYVMRLAEDSALRQRVGEAARCKAKEKYGLDVYVSQFWGALGL